ncbi:unnamed protein product, partial [Phaeothamnion confervicola]
SWASAPLLLLWIGAALASRMHQHSFAPPFLDVDGMGNRVVSETWSPDGITRTAKNFVRLTPDRQVRR